MIRSIYGKRPRIAGSAFVSEAAYVVGDVEIGEGSSVWPGAVVRADSAPISIGRNVHIEDNSVIHSGDGLTIGDNVVIGHSVVVHGKRIGHDVLIGNSATLLEKTEVGDYCLVSAGSVIPAGAVIPERSFVEGMPAKAVGTTRAQQIDRIRHAVDVYTRRAAEYKAEGL